MNSRDEGQCSITSRLTTTGNVPKRAARSSEVEPASKRSVSDSNAFAIAIPDVEGSTPVTEYPCCARNRAVAPLPQPSSKTSRGAGAASPRIRSSSGQRYEFDHVGSGDEYAYSATRSGNLTR